MRFGARCTLRLSSWLSRPAALPATPKTGTRTAAPRRPPLAARREREEPDRWPRRGGAAPRLPATEVQHSGAPRLRPVEWRPAALPRRVASAQLPVRRRQARIRPPREPRAVARREGPDPP